MNPARVAQDLGCGLSSVRVPLAGTDGEIFVRVGGPEDAASVLLLHGFPDTGLGWRDIVPTLLAAGYRVLVPDQRGYGLSDAPTRVRDYAIEHLIADALAIITSLAGGSAHVVGHDWGGAVAWALAEREPQAVRSLTVLNCPPVHVLRRAWTFDPSQLLRSWYIFFFQLPYLPERRLVRAGPALQRLAGATGDVLDAYTEIGATPRAWFGPLAWYRAALRHRTPPRRDVCAPTLLLWGTSDPALGDRLAAPSLDHVRDGILVRIEGAGHWTPTRAAPQVLRHLLPHLNAHGGHATRLIKIVQRDDWPFFEGRLLGSPDDRRDGFIHLCTPAQQDGVLARHFAGQRDLLALAIDPSKLQPRALRWEPSPTGTLYPHLYGALYADAVVGVTPV